MRKLLNLLITTFEMIVSDLKIDGTNLQNNIAIWDRISLHSKIPYQIMNDLHCNPGCYTLQQRLLTVTAWISVAYH